MSQRIKLAIIGGGPSAFFAASRLLQLFPLNKPRQPDIVIHIYDRLFSPHGLVRYGVAPDHPEVKNCTHKFDITATDPRVSFFGNVNISSTPSSVPNAIDVPLKVLYPHYTHLLLSTGCTVPKLHSALPLSDICHSALDLVHWYTQHPSSQFTPQLDKINHVSVIGHGNVALDVARILLAPVEYLEKYDVPSSVLDVLSRSAVEHVSIFGRRGPLEASFTTKELREMINLPNATMVPLSEDVLAESNAGAELTRQQTRLLELLQKGSKEKSGKTKKSWSLDFFRSPTGLATGSENSKRAGLLSLAHTALDADRKALLTGKTESAETDLILTSLGYHAEPTSKWYDPALGTIRNTGGRVIDSSGRIMRDVYASGWAATGARGVLASTMLNAHAVVDTIISDLRVQAGDGDAVLQTGAVPPPATGMLDGETKQLLNPDADMDSVPKEIQIGKKTHRVIDYDLWKKIDDEEVLRGSKKGKERERMTWEEADMLCATLRR